MLLKYYKIIIIIIFLLYIYNCLLFKGGSPCDLTNFFYYYKCTQHIMPKINKIKY